MMSIPTAKRLARATKLSIGLAVIPGIAALLIGVDFGSIDAAAAAQFLLVMTALSLLDVFLPHGDSIDIDAPLVVAALYLFGAGVAVLIVLASRIAAHGVRNGIGDAPALINGLIKRLAAALSVAGVMLLLGTISMPPLGPYIEVFGIGVVYLGVQLIVGQLGLVAGRQDSLFRAVRSNLALQGSVLAASVSIAILTVVVHEGMGVWGLLITLFLVATMRQSFALLLDVRHAYHATVETLIGAMEVQSPQERGLGERTAQLARMCGAEFGWFGKRVEHMGYAALFAHYGLAFTRYDEDADEPVRTPLAEVEFLKPVEPVVALVRKAGEDAGPVRSKDLIAAYLVSRAFGHVQGYALQATSQIGSQLDPRVRTRADKAFQRALAKAASQ